MNARRFLTALLFALVVPLLNVRADPYELKWGLVLPLSGPAARAGVDIRRGFEMAVRDLASKSSVQHTLVVEDSEFQSKGAVSAAQKLLNVDKVDILVALWDTADPVAPLAERYDRLHASIRWNSNLADQFQNTFTFESTYEDYGREFIRLFKRLGVQSIAVVSQESAGWNLVIPVLETAARKEGITITSTQTYISGQDDFRSVLTRALSKSPEVILVNDVGENLELITKQIRAMRPSQRVTGYLGYPVNLSFYEKEYYVDQLWTDPAFAERFRAEYGEPLYVRAQLAYDLTHIVDQAARGFSTKPSTKDLREALQRVSEYSGASGAIKGTNNGKVFRTTCRFMQIKGGVAVPVE